MGPYQNRSKFDNDDSYRRRWKVFPGRILTSHYQSPGLKQNITTGVLWSNFHEGIITDLTIINSSLFLKFMGTFFANKFHPHAAVLKGCLGRGSCTSILPYLESAGLFTLEWNFHQTMSRYCRDITTLYPSPPPQPDNL